MTSLLTYDSEAEQGVIESQTDPLVGDIKVELDIKSEPEDVCDIYVSSKEPVGKDGEVENVEASDSETYAVRKKSKRKAPKVRTVRIAESHNDSSESNSSDDNIRRRKRKKKVKEKHKKSKRGRKKKGLEYATHEDQALPHVKDAVFSTFLLGEGGSLGCVKYKGVELRRSANNLGYSLADEELERFKTEESGKVEYSCEDCDYSVEYKSAFKVHFVMHANVYFIMESINKTLNKNYCHMCNMECQSDSLLSRHLKTHKQKQSSKAKTKKKVDDKTKVKVNDAVEENIEDETTKQIVEDVKEDIQPVSPRTSLRRFSKSSDAWSSDGVDLFGDDNLFDGAMQGNDADTLQQSDDDDDNIALSKIVMGNIKLEVEFSNTSDDKDKIEIKKELDVVNNYTNYGTVEDLCEVKEEKREIIVDAADLLPKHEEIFGLVRCKRCKYETEEGLLSKHICKEVRQCDMCDKILLNQRIYRYHRKLHFCDKCSFKSANPHEVSEHRKTSTDCWSKCTNCDFKTMNTQSFQRHLKTKTCFKDKSIKMEKSAEMLHCDTCAYKTKYKDILIKHMKQHRNWKYSNQDAFMCNLCGKSCYSRTTLITHYKSHYCYKCAFMSLNTHDVLEHKKTNPNCLYKCEKCSFTTPHTASLRRHVRLYCGKFNPDEQTDESQACMAPGRGGKKGRRLRLSKNLHCDQCNYRTHSKVYLTWHIMKHSDPKPFHCSKCDFRCSQKGNLLMHEKKHIDGKTYCCNVCDFQCSFYKVFLTHKKIHSEEETETKTEIKERDPRFYYCDRCEFRTKYPQYLKNHNLKHDNIRPYLCDYCGNTYSSLIDYHVHKNNAHKTHPKKIYKCSYCDYSYSNKNTVTVHERKHTGAKPHSCEFCSYCTSYAGNLRAHRKKHLKRNEIPFANP